MADSVEGNSKNMKNDNNTSELENDDRQPSSTSAAVDVTRTTRKERKERKERKARTSRTRSSSSSSSMKGRYPILWIMIVVAAMMSIVLLFNATSMTDVVNSVYGAMDCPTVTEMTAHQNDYYGKRRRIGSGNITETDKLILQSSSYQLIVPTDQSRIEDLISSTNVVYMVMSRRDGFNMRQSIRETWASSDSADALSSSSSSSSTNSSSSTTTTSSSSKTQYKTIPNVFFVVGQACTVPEEFRKLDEGENPLCQIEEKILPRNYSVSVKKHMEENDVVTERLLDEFHKHQDIIIINHVPDVYRSLPQKLKAAYTYVDEYLPTSIRWIVKVDDDSYVRPVSFEKYLSDTYPFPSSASATATTTAVGQLPFWVVGGDIRRQNFAHQHGKWREVPQFIRGGRYPPFPIGSRGHAATRSVASYVAKNKDVLVDYQGEDTSLGIWFSSHTAGSPDVKWIDAKVDTMVNNQDCRSRNTLVSGYNISPVKKKICYDMDKEAAAKGEY